MQASLRLVVWFRSVIRGVDQALSQFDLKIGTDEVEISIADKYW